jgi:hypothetical protein
MGKEEKLLVQLHSSGRVKFVKMFLNEDTVNREWGLIDGKVQNTSNTYGYINKGKSNELSPKEAAVADFDRIITKKIKEGYIEVDSLDNLPDLKKEYMSFSDLPTQFSCSKPIKEISKVKFNTLLLNDKLRPFIKENGLCHFILVTDTGDIKIYTRRIDDHTKKYPSIVEDAKKLNMPKKTLLATEFIIDPILKIPHMKAFKLMSSISRSDTLKGKVKEDVTTTLALQKDTPVCAVVFNILFLAGTDMTKKPYNTVLNMIQREMYAPHIIPPRELVFNNHAEAVEWAKNNKHMYEGMVVWNSDENAEITYNGKPSRRACYKLKAKEEDDVIAYGWTEGSGSKQGKIGSLLIGKYDGNGNLVELGSVGTGLKIKEGDCEIDNWSFPCVIEIEYEQQFDTGRYQFPVFIKKHGDKLPEEVII